LQIEGGEAELRAFYQRLNAHGVQVDFTAEHFLTKSIYFFDPDGNRLELFCESMDMAAAKQYLHDARELSELMQPLDLESATAS
jgi:catechol-2,3-dioxygenase